MVEMCTVLKDQAKRNLRRGVSAMKIAINYLEIPRHPGQYQYSPPTLTGSAPFECYISSRSRKFAQL